MARPGFSTAWLGVDRGRSCFVWDRRRSVGIRSARDGEQQLVHHRLCSFIRDGKAMIDGKFTIVARSTCHQDLLSLARWMNTVDWAQTWVFAELGYWMSTNLLERPKDLPIPSTDQGRRLRCSWGLCPKLPHFWHWESSDDRQHVIKMEENSPYSERHDWFVFLYGRRRRFRRWEWKRGKRTMTTYRFATKGLLTNLALLPQRQSLQSYAGKSIVGKRASSWWKLLRTILTFRYRLTVDIVILYDAIWIVYINLREWYRAGGVHQGQAWEWAWIGKTVQRIHRLQRCIDIGMAGRTLELCTGRCSKPT